MNDMTTRIHNADDLAQALNDAVATVKAQPANTNARLQLFKLCCLQGDWSRALRQLEIVAKTDKEATRQCELYKNLILSERLRAEVLSGEREATGLGDGLPEWCSQLTQANAHYHRGEQEQGEALRQQALESVAPTAGNSATLGDFSWIMDGDDRLGPVCEFIFAGGYRWVPFVDIEQLNVTEPGNILDLVWAPASLNVKGKVLQGYVPARYPVDSTDEAALLLGGRSEWKQQGERFTGQGRKMWISSEQECALFETGDMTCVQE